MDKLEVQGQDEPKREESASRVDFTPYRPPHRRPGTGCVSKINDHLWEGRYSPKWIDGKKHARNIYAHTREECEEKLAELIVQMKRELAQPMSLSWSQGKHAEGSTRAPRGNYGIKERKKGQQKWTEEAPSEKDIREGSTREGVAG